MVKASTVTENITNVHSIFRPNARNNLNVLNFTQEPFKIISYSSWIWMLVLVLIAVSIVIWGIFGKVSVNVISKGIIVPQNSQAIPIIALYQGYVSEVYIKPGMSVRKGLTLALVSNPHIDEDLKYLKTVYKNNEHLLNEFKLEAEKKNENLSKQFNRQRTLLKNDLKRRQNRLVILRSILSKKEKLFIKHYATITDLENSREEINVVIEDINKIELNLNDLPIKFNEAQNYLQEQTNKYLEKYQISKHDLDKKTLEKLAGSIITSQADGEIISINVSKGDYITAGKTLFTLVVNNFDDDLEALVFINHSEGKKISIGMDAYVLPDAISAYEYGYIKGKVVNISEYPITKDSVFPYLANMNLVDEFFTNGVPFLAKIKLTRNNKTISGLSWTTRNGATFKLKPGSTVSVKITSKKCSPMHLLTKT